MKDLEAKAGHMASPDLPPMPRPGLLRRMAEKRSPRRVKTSFSLRFYAEVLKLRHLHYGLWDGEPLTLDGLRSAQQRYSETLAAWIPEEAKSILDVGCGVGSFAAMLQERGLAVEGLSPDPYQQRCFAERVGAPFHLVRFQELVPSKAYDLVMMSESVQYIWMDRLFAAVRRAAPEGYWLLADYFRIKVDGELAAGSGHDLDVFMAGAEQNGLVLEKQEDITDRVLPTLDLGRQWLENHIDPTLKLINESLEARYPRLHTLGRKLLKRRLAKAQADRALVDSDHFKKTRRYLIMRFRSS